MVLPWSFLAVVSRLRRIHQVSILLLTVLWLTLALPSNPTPVIAQTAAHARVEEVERELTIYVDWTQSLHEIALSQAVRTLRTNLPHIIEKWRVTKLWVYCFGPHGWITEEIFTLDLPQLILPQPQQASNGCQSEACKIFKPIRDAQRDQATSELATQEAAAQRTYRQEITEALRTMDNVPLVPPANLPTPRCSNLNGILHRIAKTGEPKPSLVAMITDGAENCSPTVETVPPPKSDLSLVIILVPEKRQTPTPPPKPGRTARAPQPVSRPTEPADPDHVQFKKREEQLVKAVPWAVVVPYSDKDLNGAFTEAKKKRIPPAKKE